MLRSIGRVGAPRLERERLEGAESGGKSGADEEEASLRG
jgi:hypothetical protein